MSKLLEPTKVKYFFSILFDMKSHGPSDIETIVLEKIREIHSFEPQFNPLTEYYSKEMGDNLKRVIYYSLVPESRNLFVPLKLWATEKEIHHSLDNLRTLNIDVGYVAKEQVLLATGKPYSHRIFLESGIYAELVYFFKEKTFHKVPWTYPDYQHQEKIDFFNRIR